MKPLFLLAAPLLLNCATVDPGRAAADVLLPVAQEVKLGRQFKKELARELTVSTNKEVNAYVKALGAQIVRVARKDIPKGLRIDFTVIDDDKTVNAFAIPGGSIYVYTGLLKEAKNAAEVVAVLSHEVSHVTRRHVAQRLIAANGLATVSEMALGKEPGLLGQLASLVVSQGAMLKYSRDQERDADFTGVPFCARAGYDPHAFISFFSRMNSSPDWLAIFQSHPDAKERVGNARKRIKAMKVVPKKTDAERHAAIKALL